MPNFNRLRKISTSVGIVLRSVLNAEFSRLSLDVIKLSTVYVLKIEVDSNMSTLYEVRLASIDNECEKDAASSFGCHYLGWF